MTRRRWLAAALGLLLAAAAAWALARWTGSGAAPGEGARSASPAEREEPHADIDEASRERLREVLRQEDERDARGARP